MSRIQTNYVPIWSDTFHDLLNIDKNVFEKKKKKKKKDKFIETSFN